MPLDPRLYGQFEAPDIMGGIERGLKMSDLIQQRREQQAERQKQSKIRDLISQNTTVDDKGNVSFNPNGISALVQAGAHEQALALAGQNQAMQKNKMEFDQMKAKADLSEIGNSLGLIRQNPKLWESEVIRLRDKGIDVSRELNPDGTVKPYDPNHVEALWKQTDQYNKHFEQQLKEADLRNKNANTAKTWAEVEKTKNETPSNGLTDGQKSVDRDYAKDYNEWTSVGKSNLAKNLQSLEEAKTMLQNDPSITGGMTGAFGDRLTADRVLKLRQKVQSAIQNSMKATLGAQFTEKEGERVLRNTFNEAASPQTNVESINALIEQLKQQEANNDSKAAYYEKTGTLSGYKSQGESTHPVFDQDVLIYSKTHGITPAAAQKIKDQRMGVGKR